MKALLLILFVCTASLAHAQGAQEEPANNNNLPTSDNLMDMQLETIQPLFEGQEGEAADIANAENYLELIEKMDVSEEEKEHMRLVYFAQRPDMTQAQQDSIGLLIEKLLQNAEPE